MATNENVNKVIYGNQTVMDITDTTAEEADVASGEVFYKADGSRSVGTLNKDSAVWGSITGTLSDQTDLQIELNRAYTKTASETSSIDDLDLIPVQKISASSDGRRNIKFRNLKSVLKGFFDDIYQAILTFENTPTVNSDNPVKSSGIYNALMPKVSESLLKSTVGWTGKNLLPNNATSQTIAGITYTVNADGSITSNGTATGWANLSLCTNLSLKKGKYVLTGIPNVIGAYITIAKQSGDISCVYSDSVRYFELASDEVLTEVRISYRANTTVSDAIFYPMLRDASITDDTYEPYHESVEEVVEEVVEQIYADNGVLGAKNLLNTNEANMRTKSENAIVEELSNGVRIYNTLPGTYQFASYWLKNLPHNTDIKVKSNVNVTSGKGRILISNRSQSATTLYEKDFSNSGTIDFIFNTGNYELLAVNFYSTVDSHISGDVTFSDLMFYLASDPDDTYVPYAMTNRELTEEKLSISELKTIASSAADFAAFKTAIANL